MQIRRVTALIDTDGRDISGNRVNMGKNTSHLISEVDIEYFLSRPLIFVVSSDVDIATYAFDTLGNVIGVTLPNGTTTAFGLSTADTALYVSAQINSAVAALQLQITSSITPLQTSMTGVQTVNTAQQSSINTLQTSTATSQTNISALQTAVASLQAALLIAPTQTVISISSPTAAEGSNLVFIITLSGATQQFQTFPFVISGTATANVDYATPITYSSGVTISGTNIIVPIGVTSFTATTLTSADSLIEPTETVIYTVGGMTSIGYITNVTPISAITRMTAFETPYGMLTTAQQTATATSGGFITACASRSDLSTDNYAVEVSTTGATGTYTRILDNRQYAPYAEVNNVLSYQHADVPFVNEFDLPALIPTSVIGVMQDSNGLQEFGLYSNYISRTVAEGSAKLFTGTTSAIFDSLPISIVDGNTAKIFLLNNLAQDTTLRTNGTTVYLKFIPKLGAQEFTGAVTPIAVTIANRASKPLPPKNVLFGQNGDLYSFPGFFFGANAAITLQIDTASRAETIPFGFFSPSGLNEAGVTYEVDFVGANGVYRTTQIPLGTVGAPNSIIYSAYQRETVDQAQGTPSYRFYAVKAGVRSLPFSYDLLQDTRGYAGVTAAVASLSTSIVSILVTVGSNTAPTMLDYVLGGTVFTTQAFGTITCDSGVTVMTNQLVQIPAGVTSFTMTVPTISATGKTLTTSWGKDLQFPTSTTVTLPLTAVSTIIASGGSTTETYSLYQNRFNVIFASACNAGAYPYSFSGTATFGGAFGTTPLAGADYTVEAMYFPGSVQTALTITNSIVNIPAGVTDFYLEIHQIIDGITEAAETIICTVNGTTSAGSNTIAANAT